MKRVAILASLVISLSSCTIGDGGSGHRVPVKRDTMAVESIKHDSIPTKHYVTVKTFKGGIMKVENPDNIHLMAGDVVEIVKLHTTMSGGGHDWQIHNTPNPETFEFYDSTGGNHTYVEHYKATVLLREHS